MINDQPPIPPLRQLYDERCAGGLAVTACYTTKWDVTFNRSQFGMKTLICGDFNSNSRWDKPRRLWNHTRCVSELESLGYMSLYHQLTGESQGAETRPTFYLHRNLGKDYHIDYAFAHRSLIKTEAINLTIGNPDSWLQHSDHMPLIFVL